MDVEKILTQEKADLICQRIWKALEENKIVGSAQMIRFAIYEAWHIGFEEGRRHPSKSSTADATRQVSAQPKAQTVSLVS